MLDYSASGGPQADPDLLEVMPEKVLIRADLRKLAESLSVPEIRYLVDFYYQVQKFRVATSNEKNALTRSEEPNAAISYVVDRMRTVEDDIKAIMDRYTKIEPTRMGAWAREVVGIGPVISAGLLSNYPEVKETVGHLWSFAGLSPATKWEKGQKRPWNAHLKRLCWIIGECFVKVSNRPRDIYGKVYQLRKEYELLKDGRGDYAEQAKEGAARVRKDTEAYKHYAQGHLPPGHIHARAKRYAVKAFLSDWHAEAYRRQNGRERPVPYAVAKLGHADTYEGASWIEGARSLLQTEQRKPATR